MSLLESTITAFDADTVPAVIPSTKLSSDAVDVTPSSIFNSAPVAVIAVPPNVNDPDTSKLPLRSTVVAQAVSLYLQQCLVVHRYSN